MTLLKGGLIWFALGVGIGRIPWQFPSFRYYDVCVPRELGSQKINFKGMMPVPKESRNQLSAVVPDEQYFQKIFEHAYKQIVKGAPSTERNDFHLLHWKHSSNGGLLPEDRAFLGEVYRKADSVFEYGLGESTKIAHHVGVRRYAGIDSDAVWVRDTRKQVASHFRFYLADIGETHMWGRPTEKLAKAVIDYQLVPLVVEPQPFDVYMVDGRFRFPCMMASFLHASARGVRNVTDTLVLVHDCNRQAYHKADHLLQLEYSSGRLCAYRRLSNTTDEELYRLWKRHYSQS